MTYNTLDAKKKKLDSLRPLPDALVKNLEQWFLIELTYTSNAIEGNTLTRKETAVVVEKGLTVGGKTLVEHLEATNHAKAIHDISTLVALQAEQLNQNHILAIHNTILSGIDNDNAGRYRSIPVRISGSRVVLPNPIKVHALMEDFIQWISSSSNLHPITLVAEAHYQLVTLHPFTDGNGRTARLLMNLLLMQKGYPPALIRKCDRLTYISSVEKAQLGGSKEDYYSIIAKAVDRSLDIYLNAMTNADVDPIHIDNKSPLLKIGQISKQSGESNATIRFWTKEGLLDVAAVTASNYQLYKPETMERIKAIRDLQAKRYTLKDIKKVLDDNNNYMGN